VFERFSDGGRRVVVVAQDEARMLGHGYIGTEHLLLGVLAMGGPVADALEQHRLGLEAVRGVVDEIIGPVEGTPGRHIPFTPRAKEVLELSLRESVRLHHGTIGPAHVVLGLLREGQGVACQAMVSLEVDRAALRTAMEALAGDEGATALHRSGGEPGLGIADAQAVLVALREAFGDDVLVAALMVRPSAEVHAVVRRDGGVGSDVVAVVQREGRWVVQDPP
jgi:ATP-dependent Clp protease ATP-binding subunit ClpC